MSSQRASDPNAGCLGFVRAALTSSWLHWFGVTGNQAYRSAGDLANRHSLVRQERFDKSRAPFPLTVSISM
jgi:hypothetical protein